MVSVVNPLLIKNFRTIKMVRQKTDSSDAKVIAHYCLQNNPGLVTPKPQENKELHEINVRLDFLNEEMGRLTGLLEKKILNEEVKKSIDGEIVFIKKTIKICKLKPRKLLKVQKNFGRILNVSRA
ncbi:MAG: transposase [Holosporaceae bacterium]|jgi:transposase|nr:transposase [Holosporaceae bacterium]